MRNTSLAVFYQTLTSIQYSIQKLFIKIRGNAVCLADGEQVAMVMVKDDGLNRHYEATHAENYKNLTDAEQEQTSAEAARTFYQAVHNQELCRYSHKIAKNTQSFHDEDFKSVCCPQGSPVTHL